MTHDVNINISARNNVEIDSDPYFNQALLEPFLKEYLNVLKVDNPEKYAELLENGMNIIITSAVRTPQHQAEIMVTKIESGSFDGLYSGDKAQNFKDKYQELKNAGKSREETIAGLTDMAKDMSDHIGRFGGALDLRNNGADGATLWDDPAFNKAAENLSWFEHGGDHYHLSLDPKHVESVYAKREAGLSGVALLSEQPSGQNLSDAPATSSVASASVADVSQTNNIQPDALAQNPDVHGQPDQDGSRVNQPAATEKKGLARFAEIVGLGNFGQNKPVKALLAGVAALAAGIGAMGNVAKNERVKQVEQGQSAEDFAMEKLTVNQTTIYASTTQEIPKEDLTAARAELGKVGALPNAPVVASADDYKNIPPAIANPAEQGKSQNSMA